MADREQSQSPEPAPDDELGVNWKAAWETEDNYWEENFSSRPYALGPDYYDQFRPAFRYGFESARDNLGRSWDDAEPDLRDGWDRYRNQSGSPSTWDEIKGAVRDAWDRVTGGKVADEQAGEGDPADLQAGRPRPRE
jgi:hypothetical protein